MERWREEINRHVQIPERKEIWILHYRICTESWIAVTLGFCEKNEIQSMKMFCDEIQMQIIKSRLYPTMFEHACRPDKLGQLQAYSQQKLREFYPVGKRHQCEGRSNKSGCWMRAWLGIEKLWLGHVYLHSLPSSPRPSELPWEVERRRGDGGKIREEKLWMKTGRPGAVELCKAISTHSLALPYDPKLEKAYIICFYQEYGVALESKMHKGIPHISSGDAQQKRQIAWDQLSHRPQRQARSPRLGTYAEGSQSSKGRMQGPCRVPRRNHMGLPGINARLSSRSRGPTITDESQRNLCCYC